MNTDNQNKIKKTSQFIVYDKINSLLTNTKRATRRKVLKVTKIEDHAGKVDGIYDGVSGQAFKKLKLTGDIFYMLNSCQNVFRDLF